MAFFTPEPPSPSKPASSGGQLKYPYTSLITSLLSLGVDLSAARSMRYGEAMWLVTARNDSMSRTADDGVRDATQSDIQKFMCG